MTPFFRSYNVVLSEGMVRTEFDGGFLSSSEYVYNAHNHAAAELIAVSDGISKIDILEHGIFCCETGDVLLIPGGIYHANCQTGQICDRFCLRFYCPGRITGNLKILMDKLSDNEQIQIHLPEIIPKLKTVRDEMMSDLPECDRMIEALLVECFIILLRNCPGQSMVLHQPERNKSDDNRIKEIERFFSKRYNKDVGISELSDVLHLSESQVNRILHDYYAQSFKEKLRVTRIQQARLLLEQTDMHISEIAFDVGYKSVAGFHSAYKLVFGITPGQYRKNRKK